MRYILNKENTWKEILNKNGKIISNTKYFVKQNESSWTERRKFRLSPRNKKNIACYENIKKWNKKTDYGVHRNLTTPIIYEEQTEKVEKCMYYGTRNKKKANAQER